MILIYKKSEIQNSVQAIQYAEKHFDCRLKLHSLDWLSYFMKQAVSVNLKEIVEDKNWRREAVTLVINNPHISCRQITSQYDLSVKSVQKIFLM